MSWATRSVLGRGPCRSTYAVTRLCPQLAWSVDMYGSTAFLVPLGARLRYGRGSRLLHANPRGRTTFKEDEYLPPVVFLKGAKAAGALDMEPDVAHSVLRRYLAVSEKGEPGWEKRFCIDENIKPQTLTMLSLILSRSPEALRKMLGKRLIMSASALGDPSATIYIMSSAIRSGDINRPEFLVPLSRLQFLANKQGRVDAMVLLGRILENQKKEAEALAMFQKAVETPGSGDDGGEALGISSDLAVEKSAALVAQGQIFLRRRDHIGAEAVFQRAALEMDNPDAYYQLALLQDLTSSTREVYLLKAASSGVLLACHELGLLQLAKAETKPEETKQVKSPHIETAKEWLMVGAAGGIGKSMLKMAHLYKAEGNIKMGLKWLESAAEVPDVASEAESIKETWAV